jgi:hypothetical protein
MSTRSDFRAMTGEAVSASSDAALMHFQPHSQFLGGLLLLIAPGGPAGRFAPGHSGEGLPSSNLKDF